MAGGSTAPTEITDGTSHINPTYDSDEDGQVESADLADNATNLGGTPAADYALDSDIPSSTGDPIISGGGYVTPDSIGGDATSGDIDGDTGTFRTFSAGTTGGYSCYYWMNDAAGRITGGRAYTDNWEYADTEFSVYGIDDNQNRVTGAIVNSNDGLLGNNGWHSWSQSADATQTGIEIFVNTENQTYDPDKEAEMSEVEVYVEPLAVHQHSI